MPANVHDSVGAQVVLRRVPLFARWEKLLLDGGYASPALIAWVESWFGVTVEIVQHPGGSGFVVQPKRWSLSALSLG